MKFVKVVQTELRDRVAYAKAHTKILYLTQEEHDGLRAEITPLKRAAVEWFGGCSVTISAAYAAKHATYAAEWRRKVG